MDGPWLRSRVCCWYPAASKKALANGGREEPRAIDMIFETLRELREARRWSSSSRMPKGLEFADVGYVLVAGRLAKAGDAKSLLGHPDIGRLFLGG
jgi:branched-chain amino acid transport system ATP-binding protein